MRALRFHEVLSLLENRSEVPEELRDELDAEVEAWVDHLASKINVRYGEDRVREIRAKLRSADEEQKPEMLREMHRLIGEIRGG